MDVAVYLPRNGIPVHRFKVAQEALSKVQCTVNHNSDEIIDNVNIIII